MFYLARALYLCLLSETQALAGEIDGATVNIEQALQENSEEILYRSSGPHVARRTAATKRSGWRNSLRKVGAGFARGSPGCAEYQREVARTACDDESCATARETGKA